MRIIRNTFQPQSYWNENQSLFFIKSIIRPSDLQTFLYSELPTTFPFNLSFTSTRDPSGERQASRKHLPGKAIILDVYDFYVEVNSFEMYFFSFFL